MTTAAELEGRHFARLVSGVKRNKYHKDPREDLPKQIQIGTTLQRQSSLLRMFKPTCIGVAHADRRVKTLSPINPSRAVPGSLAKKSTKNNG